MHGIVSESRTRGFLPFAEDFLFGDYLRVPSWQFTVSLFPEYDYSVKITEKA